LPAFVDTNVVVYAFTDEPKSGRARAVLRNAVISVQVLNEFANVAIRKRLLQADALAEEIASIRLQASHVTAVDAETHDLARELAFGYRLGFYDSALLAAALLADCDVFYSEDMQDSLVIDGVLSIRNPFA
jgi:predicted nucleic acid-binding protein